MTSESLKQAEFWINVALYGSLTTKITIFGSRKQINSKLNCFLLWLFRLISSWDPIFTGCGLLTRTEVAPVLHMGYVSYLAINLGKMANIRISNGDQTVKLIRNLIQSRFVFVKLEDRKFVENEKCFFFNVKVESVSFHVVPVPASNSK